jgi:hypothetical protein
MPENGNRENSTEKLDLISMDYENVNDLNRLPYSRQANIDFFIEYFE